MDRKRGSMNAGDANYAFPCASMDIWTYGFKGRESTGQNSCCYQWQSVLYLLENDV